jgi:drug/metabolite transporter (DMT)-like permease
MSDHVSVEPLTTTSKKPVQELDGVDDAHVVRWLLLAFYSNTAFGAYVVFSRYLQVIAGIPSFALIALSNTPGMLITIPFVIADRTVDWKAIRRNKFLAPTCILVVARSFTLILASRYASAVTVQVIALLAPFVVALLSHFALKDQIPKYTIPCSIMCLLGALLTCLDELQLEFDESRALGILLSVLTVLALAGYIVCLRGFTRRTANNREATAIMLLHYVAIVSSGFIASAASQESYQVFAKLDGVAWAIFFIFAFCVLLLGNVSQVVAIRKVGASLVSSLLPWRLVVTVALAAWLLQEYLDEPMEISGALVVVVTVIIYLWLQHRLARQRLDQRKANMLQRLGATDGNNSADAGGRSPSSDMSQIPLVDTEMVHLTSPSDELEAVLERQREMERRHAVKQMVSILFSDILEHALDTAEPDHHPSDHAAAASEAATSESGFVD